MTSMNSSLHGFTAVEDAAVGTLTVSRDATLDQPPSIVWKLIGEFNALDIWLPPVQASSLRGVGTAPGAIRVLDLGGGASVTEELLDYDSARHRYTYAFVESPLPVKRYVATIALSAAPNGRTLIKWHSNFEADGAPDDQAQAAVQGIYDVGLAKLVSIFRNSTAQ
jgi:mxaD protein